MTDGIGLGNRRQKLLSIVSSNRFFNLMLRQLGLSPKLYSLPAAVTILRRHHQAAELPVCRLAMSQGYVTGPTLRRGPA